MKYIDLLKNNAISEQAEEVIPTEEIVEKIQSPEELLRDAGFKIKLVTPTSFGTQIDFSKKYKDGEIKDLLKEFTTKIKNKSVFIVD